MKTEQLIDCEGITLESNKPFAFSCCDCGLTHHMIIVSEDGRPVGFAVKRITPAPEQATPQDAAPAVAVEAVYVVDLDKSRRSALEAAQTNLSRLIGGCPECGRQDCIARSCVISSPPVVQPTLGQDAKDARIETMEIRYETFGNCLWHTDCKVNSFKSGVMQVLSHEKTSSTMKCLSCGQVGAYPKGRVGTVCVPVISPAAAILSSEQDQAGGGGRGV